MKPYPMLSWRSHAKTGFDCNGGKSYTLVPVLSFFEFILWSLEMYSNDLHLLQKVENGFDQ